MMVLRYAYLAGPEVIQPTVCVACLAPPNVVRGEVHSHLPHNADHCTSNIASVPGLPLVVCALIVWELAFNGNECIQAILSFPQGL